MQKIIYICDGCGKEMTKEERVASYYLMSSYDTCKTCNEKLKDVKKRFEEELQGIYKKLKGDK